ncbi:hypothetical protein JVT61DRAFT_2515 [Boletus reticuloceps]|uniref:SPRY domain-containing protein n=1 Tax=Boletus reticuloceps TaxID=495285 RepID=A0A8I2YTN6_9AGAM|nr:hypothetical protein JVT61DRAFT_2515 [Boletus reticuloceps]
MPSPSESSRPSTPSASNNNHPAKKRKVAPPLPSPSPAPSDSNANTANVVLPARHDLFSRPRLTISRFPTFPDTPGVIHHITEQLAMNRIGFRYVPAGVAPPGSAFPCRTIESAPPCFRVSWEDRSAFVKVTPDGLGLLGERGFRSARCNAPVREGAWYMEVCIECGGGDRPPDLPDANMCEGSHVRLGWARREAPLNGPVGLDGYSYGYRDKTGDKVTLSRPRSYGQPFRTGDVIGMYIFLPARRKPDPSDPHDPAHPKRERIAIEFKGQEYFESLEYPQSKEMIKLMEFSTKASSSVPLPSVPPNKKASGAKSLPERKGPGVETPVLRPLPELKGSHIAFFVNGECQSIAFRDLYDYLPLPTTPASRKKDKENSKKRAKEGAPREHKENPFDDGTLGYYPFISLFNYARVRINPGPDFDFPPPPDIEGFLRSSSGEDVKPSSQHTWRPMCERYPEFMQGQWDLDAREEEEAKVEAALWAEREKAEVAKKTQKELRRQQNAAKKRAREAELRGASVHAASPLRETSIAEDGSAAVIDDRFGPSVSSLLTPTLPASEDIDQAHSPAPTATSSVDYHHIPDTESGYNSEALEGMGEGDVEQEGDMEIEDGGETLNMPVVDIDLSDLI